MLARNLLEWIHTKEESITVGETKHGLAKKCGLNVLEIAIDSALVFGTITVAAACAASAVLPFRK